jgi:hypothetical protein
LLRKNETKIPGHYEMMQLMEKKMRNLKMKSLANLKPLASIPDGDINLLLAQGITTTSSTVGPVAAPTALAVADTMAPTVADTTGTARALLYQWHQFELAGGPPQQDLYLTKTLVSPYELRDSNKNNPQHEGLMQMMQMMQMSMLQHNQYMEEQECKRQGGKVQID